MNTFRSEQAEYYYPIKATYFELINQKELKTADILDFSAFLFKLGQEFFETGRISLANFCFSIGNDLFNSLLKY